MDHPLGRAFFAAFGFIRSSKADHVLNYESTPLFKCYASVFIVGPVQKWSSNVAKFIGEGDDGETTGKG